MDATTFSHQTRSLRLLFGSAVGRSELLHLNFLETRKLEDRTMNKRQSAEHLRLDFLPDRPRLPCRHSNFPRITSGRLGPIRHTRPCSSAASPKTDPSPGGSSPEVGSPQEVEAMLSVHFSSRPHTRLPAQERNCLTRNPFVDDLAVGMGHLQQGKKRQASHERHGAPQRCCCLFSWDRG